MPLDRLGRSQQQGRGAVGHLGAVAGGDLADRPIEYRTQLGQYLRRGIRSQAIVVFVDGAVAGVQRLDLVHEPGVVGGGESPVAACRIGVHCRAVDREARRQLFGGLAHRQPVDRVGQAAQQGNDGFEMLRAQLHQGAAAGTQAACLAPSTQPGDHHLV